MKLSRGIRNNNPANIRRSATKWAYLKPVQSDKQFCQFLEMRYGIRAFFILMRTYRYKYGLKTPREIINRFAPASENDVESYQYSKVNQRPTYEKIKNSDKIQHHSQRQEQND